MNVKTLTALIIAFATFLPFGSTAQKYGATPEDSLQCVRNLSVYVDFVNQKDYKGAYKYWSVPFDVCPKSSLKMYVDGTKILDELIEKETDEARKKRLIDTLLMIYDRRIENFGKEGYVLGRKGSEMYKYKTPGVAEAYATLEKSVTLQGNESEAATVLYYFVAAVTLERSGKMEAGEVVELFTKCTNIADYNIQNASSDREKASFEKAMANLEKYAEPYLSCDAIDGIVQKNFEANKGNAEWLEKMANLLDKKKCTELPVFFEVANTLHQLKPSAESAANMGILALNKKKHAEAIDFFKQALNLLGDSDNDKKADYEFYLAKTYFAQGQYSSSRQHALAAIKLRSGWGEPYILIGDMYAASFDICDGKDKELKAVYWVAVDKYAQAKSVDASETDRANKKIATYSQYFPEKKDAFFYNVTEGTEYTVGCWINETTKARVK
jgi:tetratricopeptide (TPR) repeat protein